MWLLTALQIPETLPDEVLAKMHAAPKADVPVADVHDLPNYDGFILGFPTRCAYTACTKSGTYLPLRLIVCTSFGGH